VSKKRNKLASQALKIGSNSPEIILRHNRKFIIFKATKIALRQDSIILITHAIIVNTHSWWVITCLSLTNKQLFRKYQMQLNQPPANIWPNANKYCLDPLINYRVCSKFPEMLSQFFQSMIPAIYAYCCSLETREYWFTVFTTM
jgi:hypothetical protein